MHCHTRLLPAATLALLFLFPSCHRTPAPLPPPTSQPRNFLPSASITEYRSLPQNWADSEANWFYNTPQGSKLIPYQWFLTLEQAGSQKLFRDAGNMQDLGYLAREPDAIGNPDGLPIGS
jgi:hypothetical protein